MVSRDTAVQIAAVVVAMTLAGLATQFGPPTSGTPLLLGAASCIVVFAGAHVYLALRGDGEDVPVAARWRFVALVVALAVATSVGAAAGRTAVAGVSLSVVLGPTVAALFVAYLLYEAREGYRASRRP